MIEVGVDTYISVEDADTYITEHYVSADERREKWEELNESDKEVYLRRAARAIDSLPYPGAKRDKTQDMAFPRIAYACGCGAESDSDIPRDIKAAQIEEAFEYATPSGDSDTHADRVGGVQAFSYDRYSVTYADSSGAGTLETSIVSSTARELLRPYTGGGYRIV